MAYCLFKPQAMVRSSQGSCFFFKSLFYQFNNYLSSLKVANCDITYTFNHD